jgi:Flp pilus assembly protein, ATPase CpaF
MPVETRFSTMAYIARRKEGTEGNRTTYPDPEDREARDATAFRRLVEDMRSFLIVPKDASDEERQQYGEVLNRAVLGFEEERRRLFVLLQDELIRRGLHEAPPPPNYTSLAEAVFSEIIGWNVLEMIIKDRDDLEEIQVVGTKIFEVRGGEPRPSRLSFRDVREVERIQQNLVLFNNEVFHPRKPWAEVMLVDGSRVTMTGFGFTSEPTLTIRFYPLREFSLDTLCRAPYHTLNEQLEQILLTLIRSYVNMIIIGPTNSGKTHLMKAMISHMPDHERIVTIEPRLELMLKRDFPNKNVVEYETDDGDAARSSSRAFRLALRQSPRRICHAEIRDEDANIYVRACTRGHEGSLTSVHVNALEDVPDAVTDMCMLDRRGMNPERLRKRIVEYVAQVGLEMAVVGGKRKLVRIGEFGLEDHDNRVVVRDLAVYDDERDDWRVSGTFSERLARKIRRHDPDGYERLARWGMMPI